MMNQSMNNEEKRQFYMDHIYSHRKDMYRILWSMFGDPDIVEEIAQGVLEHAWKGLDTLKDQNKSWAWLKGILRNESRTHIRKKEESPAMEIWESACEYIGEDDLLYYEQDILDSIVKKETGAQITELLEQMDEKYKSVIKMHLILQFSLKEIADMKGMEYSTVRSLYSRGIRKLRNSCLSLEEGGSDE